jgi:hypothetical protein
MSTMFSVLKHLNMHADEARRYRHTSSSCQVSVAIISFFFEPVSIISFVSFLHTSTIYQRSRTAGPGDCMGFGVDEWPGSRSGPSLWQQCFTPLSVDDTLHDMNRVHGIGGIHLILIFLSPFFVCLFLSFKKRVPTETVQLILEHPLAFAYDRNSLWTCYGMNQYVHQSCIPCFHLLVQMYCAES